MATPESAPSSGDIIRLNVGGEVFVTTYGTLSSVGENFFTSLLSGRYKNKKDESGAIFIDRSPLYFGPLLHFLRSQILDIPPGVSHTSLKREAEFYGMSSVVEYFKSEEEERKKKNIKEIAPLMKTVGCYINEKNTMAFLFSPNKKLTVVTGEEAFTQAMVVQDNPVVPKEWKASNIFDTSFAIFFDNHVQRGLYKMNSEGRGMVMTLPGPSGASNRQHLASLSPDFTSLCFATFSCVGGSVQFTCKEHDNPHHFHIFKFQKF